jgi:O-antigen/teichoic acid export membrane protein
MPSVNNKRIAKNTLLLYVRMLVMMLVSLYTVRVILNTLGSVDYGIYNVVGGIIAMFSFLSSTLASASQRFFAFELGRRNYNQLQKTFSMSILIYGMLAVLILVVAEIIGIWFINNLLTIPKERIDAANWVYQFAILSFMATIIRIPYQATIIAHERMHVFAYISIVEVSLKLLIVFLLVIIPFDKLKLYAILYFLVTLTVTTIFNVYCRKKFVECKFIFHWNTALFKMIASYSGWNMFETSSKIISSQGGNILLGMFFSPIVNAARGIAHQVSVTMNHFVLNFMTATRPQIIKYHAQGDNRNMFDLAIRSSKFCFYLMFVISSPVLLETKYILTLWLHDVPTNTIIFKKLIIITILIEVIS